MNAVMSRLSGKKARVLLIGCTAAASVLAVDAASAVALIVRSSGPSATSYKPGRALSDDTKLALRSGDTLTVLAADSTKTFRGPGTFAINAGGERASAMAGRRGRTSALRTAGIVPRSPTLWHVDVAQSGKMCLADQKEIVLWRANAAEATVLTVKDAAGARQTVQWPAGQATLAWPSAMPIAQGARYQVSTAGNAPTDMSFQTLPTVPTDLTSVAQSLIEQGCDSQLDLLIQTVPEAIPPAS